MSIRAVEAFVPEWFTPASETDDTTPTRFKIRGLDGAEQAELAAEIGFNDSDDMEISARGMSIAIKYGVTEWENLVDGDDKPVKIPGDARARQALLPYSVQAELAARIFELTYVTPEDKKK